MKILITGADLNKVGDQYEVVYQGRVVFQNKLKDVCLVTALDAKKLATLASRAAAQR